MIRFHPAIRASAHHRSSMARREMLVSRIFVSWNQLDGWLRQVEGLRRVA